MKPNSTTRKVAVLISLIVNVSYWANAQGNLVVNGGFDVNAAGWTITNDDRGYDAKNGNPEGDLALASDLPPFSSPSTASQIISNLTSGSIYIVSGDYQKIADDGGGSVSDLSFGVAMNGVFLFETADPGDFHWHNFTFEYMANSTSALLSLSSQLNATPFAYAIDNISMEIIPEPSVVSLILLGSGVLIYARRKKHFRI